MNTKLTLGEKELYNWLKETANGGRVVQMAQVDIAKALDTTQQAISTRLSGLRRKGVVEVKILMDRGRPNLMLLN